MPFPALPKAVMGILFFLIMDYIARERDTGEETMLTFSFVLGEVLCRWDGE